MPGWIRKRRSRFDGVNLLELRPLRQAGWRDEDGVVMLTRRHPRQRGQRGLLARVDHWLATPRLKLDAIGSFAWRRFDGRTSVGEVVQAVRKEFGEPAEPVEERLGSFVRLLRREGLVKYEGFDA
jgi:hypothetical protein